MDPNVGPFVPQTLAFTFWCATSIRDQVVQSGYKGFNRHDPCKWLGTFMCGAANTVDTLIPIPKQDSQIDAFTNLGITPAVKLME